MHIVITADTIGGVWTYTRELVTGLVRRGVKVTLVSFGEIPAPGQTRWIEQLQGSPSRAGNHCFTYYPTAFKLEWMQNSQTDMKASADYLRDLIRQTEPDVLHFNQFCYGALDCELPRVVVAHSDVVSWWVAVHDSEPPATSWLSWYRDGVTRGLTGATAVIAPSQWMLEQIKRHYVVPRYSEVIHNGRTPALFNPHVTKEDKIVTVGRIWDRGKNAGLLLRASMPMPVCIVGADHGPEGGSEGLSPRDAGPQVHFEPRQAERQLAQTLGRAAIYVAPSQYEPFGLAPVEAALSRCALVAADIPSLRELWEGAAVFFRSNDAEALRLALELLMSDPALRKKYANLAYDHARRKFNAERMVESYMKLYGALAPAAVVAA